MKIFLCYFILIQIKAPIMRKIGVKSGKIKNNERRIKMQLNNKEAKIFIPDKTPEKEALNKTTNLCFGAHQDDIEIMAYGHIARCFEKSDEWFAGVVVTDGSGSPRAGIYENFSDDEMKKIREKEQEKAAFIGRYSAQFLLSYPSSEVKDPKNEKVSEEIKRIIKECKPKTVLTHNLADKHDTHVAVAVKTIEAIRMLDPGDRPEKVYAMEVWRGLDWLCDKDKTVFDTSKYPNIAAALLGVFDSQITGGKRYDLATIGRREANATFFESHFVDETDSMAYSLDITNLCRDDSMSCEEFIGEYIENFKSEVITRIRRFGN